MTGIAEVLGSTDRMTKRNAALAFARAGVPVFPCIPIGKRPLTPTGFHDATTDDETICQWWRWWPTANIGIPTGMASGIDVVDVDVRENGSGMEVFQHAAERLGIRDLTRVRTPSGGMHAYYPTSGHPQSCWQAAAAHIDFRGDGGYVVVPPSQLRIHESLIGYRLTSITRDDATPVDAILLRNLIDPRAVQPDVRRHATVTQPDALAAWVSRLREGERNHGLFWAACRLVENGATAQEATSVLVPAATAAGLGEREIATTIRSAWRQSAPRPPERALSDTGPQRVGSAPSDLGPVI